MNLILRVVVMGVLGAIAQTFLPWWSSVVVAVIVELILGKGDGTSFFSGFYGVAIPWMILATLIDVNSDSLLTVQVLQLFKLPEFSIVMIIITGLFGGLIAGMGSLSGGWIRAAFQKTNG
jgi:hypothetical protein